MQNLIDYQSCDNRSDKGEGGCGSANLNDVVECTYTASSRQWCVNQTLIIYWWHLLSGLLVIILA